MKEVTLCIFFQSKKITRTGECWWYPKANEKVWADRPLSKSYVTLLHRHVCHEWMYCCCSASLWCYKILAFGFSGNYYVSTVCYSMWVWSADTIVNRGVNESRKWKGYGKVESWFGRKVIYSWKERNDEKEVSSEKLQTSEM